MEQGNQAFLARLKDLRREAENRFELDVRAKTLVALDQLIGMINAADHKARMAESSTAYCGLQLNMSISEGPTAENARCLAEQAAKMVQSLDRDDSHKTDEAEGTLDEDQLTMSVSQGPICQSEVASTAADAAAIVRALVKGKG